MVITPFHFDQLRLNGRTKVPNTEIPISAENIRIKKKQTFSTHWVVCLLPSFWSGCLWWLLLIVCQWWRYKAGQWEFLELSHAQETDRRMYFYYRTLLTCSFGSHSPVIKSEIFIILCKKKKRYIVNAMFSGIRQVNHNKDEILKIKFPYTFLWNARSNANTRVEMLFWAYFSLCIFFHYIAVKEMIDEVL